MHTVAARNPLYAHNSLQRFHLTFFDGLAANKEYCTDSGILTKDQYIYIHATNLVSLTCYDNI